jgi:HSP20 family protein
MMTRPWNIERFFDDFNRFASFPFANDYGRFAPKVNVIEREGEFEVSAELPGLEAEDIDLRHSREGLIIQGEKKQESEMQDDNVYRVERRYGSFCRTIPLAEDVVDFDQVQASFKNGILTVILPKVEQENEVSKRIEVSAG